MRLSRSFVFVLSFAIWGVALGQNDEDSEVAPEPERRLEWNGNLDVKYMLFHMDERSPFYTLQFLDERPSTSLLAQYRLEPYLNAEYHTRDLRFILKTHASYYSDTEAQVDLFEAYGSFNLSFNTTLQAGKRVYNWGKGYAFNPVGFVNSIKDPENPELAQAGLLSANVEYVKSFQSDVLQSFSFTAVFIPSSTLFNSRYGEVANTDMAMKVYFLLLDTDIDLMTYQRKTKPRRYGLDFARNLQGNLEIHGEISYNLNAPRTTIRNGFLANEQRDAFSYLFGVRFLSASNTTVIAEYFHNGNGMSKGEYEEYYNFVLNGASNPDPLVAQQTLAISQTSFRGNNITKDYIYVKLTHPEPFEWLYFTPSIFSIYNLTDGSFLVSLQLTYKPVTNMEFVLWPTVLGGKSTAEYGGKQVMERLEFWMRVFF